MISTVTDLIIKVEQLEWDLAKVKEELVRLQASAMKSMTPEDRVAARSERIQAQNKKLSASIKNSLVKPNTSDEIRTVEELQQLLLEEGIKPEDNLGSRAIIEEREKRCR